MIALLLLFIWSNSLADSERSNALSGWVERWLKPLIDPHGKIVARTLDYEVRKVAHVIEFALLGALLVFGTAQMKNRSMWLLLFIILLAAVIDETIQTFTGRMSQVWDIWIDFFGAGVGIVLAYIVGRFSQKEEVETIRARFKEERTSKIHENAQNIDCNILVADYCNTRIHLGKLAYEQN